MADELRIDGRANVREALRKLVEGLAGRQNELDYLTRGIRLRIGMVALACVQETFVVKAGGGTGDDGIKWDPLKKETVANRPIGPKDVLSLKAIGITKRKHGYGARKQDSSTQDVLGRQKRSFLTDAQDKRWKAIFAFNKINLMAKHGLGDGESSARAAAIAWATLKAEGAKTKLDVLGSRTVQIGRDTGRLFNSLSPGIPEPEQHSILAAPPDAPVAEDRILRDEVGAVVVGSNVVYAGRFHAKRQLWPDQLPPAWEIRIVDAAMSGIAEAVKLAEHSAG